MSKRYLVSLATSFLIVFSGFLFAQEPVPAQEPAQAQEQESVLEMKRIQNVLSVINSEIKSDLDQLVVLQEAGRANVHVSLEAMGGSPDSVNIDDITAAQRRVIERKKTIDSRIEAILTRTAELSAKKQQLLERFMELSVVPLVTVTKSTN